MDKKLIYGTFSAVSILVVVAVLIFINLIFEKINVQYDLTEEAVYTLSDKSVEALGKIEKDLSIYVVSETGKEDKRVEQLLGEYTKNCSKISLEYINPYTNPDFVKGFSEDGEEIENDSVIVTDGQRHRIIKPEELYGREADYNSGTYKITMSAESEITNAITFVAMGENYIIYYVVGHNEAEMSPTLKTAFEKINYDVKELNITSEKGVPDDCGALFITTPLKDYSKEESEQVIDYLSEDGRAMMFLNRNNGEKTEFFDRILSAYGVKTGNLTLFEADTSHYSGYPTWLMPEISGENEITEVIKNSGYPVMLMDAQNIELLDLKKESITAEPLLTTTDSSYGKSDVEYKTVNFEEGDKKGPFNVALAITDSYYTDKTHTTKIMVCGSSSIVDEDVLREIPTSLMFTVYSANWLKDSEDVSVYIPTKSLEPDLIAVPDSTKSNITIFVCAVIPGIIFIIGILVWYKRRYG